MKEKENDLSISRNLAPTSNSLRYVCIRDELPDLALCDALSHSIPCFLPEEEMNMKLSEAILSGKPFRRAADNMWWEVHTQSGYIVPLRGVPESTILPPSAENLTADDWEVEEDPPILITRDDLWRAHDGHPVPVPCAFTDEIWQYLKEIVNERDSTETKRPYSP